MPSRNIATIHLTTTNCFVMYTTDGFIPEGELRRLLLNTAYFEVPTAVLFCPDGTIDSFGWDAHHNYLHLDDCWRLEYVYFEKIKLTKVFIINRYLCISMHSTCSYIVSHKKVFRMKTSTCRDGTL